jgi:hypothetical protein
MSSPVDTIDFVTQVGAPLPQFIGLDLNRVPPFTTGSLPCSPWQSIEFTISALNAVTANNVLTFTVTWYDGTGPTVVWTDVYTLWSSQTVNIRTPNVIIQLPVRGTAFTVSFVSNGANDTVNWTAFGTSRVIGTPRIRSSLLVYGLHLFAQAGIALGAGAATSFRVGPVNRDLTGFVHANSASFFMRVFAEVPAVAGLTEAQLAVSTPNAVVGTAGLLATTPAHGLAVRLEVNNNAAGAGNCDIVVTDSYD